ncbi:NIPSNAP family protein [Chitinophaga arvensicola]|uniref:NIPSNAP protein n=1 Tax=Chitinophaga arvensicola TaxID=29529 RepID=A0A1I0SD90_9BACT|nr:NIPSNAP family protein [Chitinophaga arvensicola]SEW55932.1 NIPSNAP protein [Chitinophaga arvensicola]
MKIYSTLLFVCLMLCSATISAKERQFYQIKIYHLKTKDQEKMVDAYLEKAFLPALHKAGIPQAGVFKPLEADTADIRIYVLIPFKSLEQFTNLDKTLQADKSFVDNGKDYTDAAWDKMPYTRIESILLLAFPGLPVLQAPSLQAPKSERVYELRSYESPTEKYHVNKVKMFNTGDEIGIFKNLNFNAVFYASVISGPRMPNLMYMTTFNNKEDRDAHWKAFVADPKWKSLSALEEYSHNVSKSDILFLRPTNYSDL